ncbi:TonB-dependent receptor [Sphingomonas sp. SRS2]|uniref:TonB-dependent receptor n=1 Tax=Sphingomonas sp. SRS2 TaxID=133190 RepID=UPI000A68C934|nr:TonB-dependent receptor plug domain-containing protein [Sphingomonas sp. SRS2]
MRKYVQPWLLSASFVSIMLPQFCMAQVPATTGTALESPPINAAELGDIVVTARRTSESIQRIPVTVSAFSASSLREASVTTPETLQQRIPGVYLGGAGASTNTVFVIRGQAKPLIGVGQPGAITYFADVPLPTVASSQPQYDMGSIQVLKGPQGTLFGRNTTGGAVLLYPQAPTYAFGGYVQGTIGNFQMRGAEGALNLPISDEKVALRIAGRYTRRDGYFHSMGINQRLYDINNGAFRASLLVQPSEAIKSLTIFDYYKANENGPGQTFIGFFPGSLLEGLAPFTNPSLNSLLSQQRSIGKRRNFSDIETFDRSTAFGLTNRTDLEVGNLTFTNIVGIRDVKWASQANFDGLPAVDLFGGGPGPVLNSYRSNAFHQVTEELQVHGKAFDDRLSWLVGGFYLTSKPDGENADRADVLNGSGTAVYTFSTENSRAIFGNLSYDLGGLAPGLKLDLGARYTWDRIDVCSALGGATPPYPGRRADCNGGVLTGAARTRARFKKPTWTAALNWQIDRDNFAYITTRRGYRAGGVNVPVLGPGLAPFQLFDPETITDVELGLKSKWTIGAVRGQVNIAAFAAKSKNVQYNVLGLFTTAGCTPASSFDGDCDVANDPSSAALIINAGDTRVRGIEASLTIHPTPMLTLDVGASHIAPKTTHTTYGTLTPFVVAGGGDPAVIPFQYVPKTTVSVGARYEVDAGAAGTFVANLDYYWSDKVTYGLYTADAYDTVNARIDLNDVAGLPIDLSLFARNLFNADWVATNGVVGFLPGIVTVDYNEPRTFGIQARYRF